MKKRGFILILITILCFTGCGSSGDPLNENNPTLPGEPISNQGTEGPDSSSADNSSNEPAGASESGPQTGSDVPSQAGSDVPPKTEPQTGTGSPQTGSDAEASPSFVLEIPEGFIETSADGFALFYTSEDGSNINMNIQEKDSSFQIVTADLLRSTLTDAYKQAFDIDVTINDNYFNVTEVDGFPAYQYSFTYELEENTVNQLIVGIDGENTCTFTFTDMSGAYMEIFESCAGNIHYSGEK